MNTNHDNLDADSIRALGIYYSLMPSEAEKLSAELRERMRLVLVSFGLGTHTTQAPNGTVAARAGELSDEQIADIADSDECNPNDRGWGAKFSLFAFARAVIAADRALASLPAATAEAAATSGQQGAGELIGYVCERIALVRMRDDVESLPLHPHKRKVVREWLDAAVADVETKGQAAALASQQAAGGVK